MAAAGLRGENSEKNTIPEERCQQVGKTPPMPRRGSADVSSSRGPELEIESGCAANSTLPAGPRRQH